MATPTRALVLVDPYNDFLHPHGVLTPQLKDMEEKQTVKHIEEATAAARANGIPVYYGLHQNYTPNSFDGWKHMTGSNLRQQAGKLAEEGTFGAQIYKGLEPVKENGDVIVSKHWNSDCFENTDLDYQLRQRDITHLTIAGLTANMCMEATARRAYELGYNVTLLKDATAGFTKEQTDVATDVIWPLFAQVVKTQDWVDSLKA